MNKVNQAQLAELFGVTPKTIREWRDMGMPCLGKEGRQYMYDSHACFSWRIEFEANRVKDKFGVDGDADEKMNLLEAKTRREAANALLAELELAEARKQVANIDDLTRNFAVILQNVRAKLVGQANRLSGSLAHQEQEEIYRILSDDTKETLKELSNYKHEYA